MARFAGSRPYTAIHWEVCILAVFLVVLCSTLPATASEPVKIDTNTHIQAASEGRITTLWPLFDFRESPVTGYRNLSILGCFSSMSRAVLQPEPLSGRFSFQQQHRIPLNAISSTRWRLTAPLLTVQTVRCLRFTRIMQADSALPKKSMRQCSSPSISAASPRNTAPIHQFSRFMAASINGSGGTNTITPCFRFTARRSKTEQRQPTTSTRFFQRHPVIMSAVFSSGRSTVNPRKTESTKNDLHSGPFSAASHPI